MSQKIVLNIIREIGGRATADEIKHKIAEDYPERTLDSYLARSLNSLQQNHLLKQETGVNCSTWELTEKGYKKSKKDFTLKNINNKCSRTNLKKEGIRISNIVGTFDSGTDFDLFRVASETEYTDYHPEVDSHLTYRADSSNSACLRVPSTGRMTVAGGKTKSQIMDTIGKFDNELPDCRFKTDIIPSNIEVQNIVGNFSLQRELELSSLADDYECMNLNSNGSVCVKYSPNLYGCGMIYRTGKVNIVGTKTYKQVENIYRRLEKIV
jgi:TATA-box binding protein (TBP) (component of TFIID and TFIIIB)